MRKLLMFLFFTSFILVFSSFVYAITGSIGNAKMILNAEVGDTIERSILVKNVNNVSVNVSLFASGDLEKEMEILDKEFILLPGEEKKAEFVVELKEPGTYDTRINVKFTPSDIKGAGVGLSSQIIIKVSGEGELDEDEEEDMCDGGCDVEDNEIEGNETIGITGKVIDSGKLIAIISSVVLAVILIILLFIYSKKTRGKLNKKRGGKK